MLLHTLVNPLLAASAVASGETTHNCETYDLPQHQACDALLFGVRVFSARAIFNIDSDEHGCYMPCPGQRSQCTASQWRQRVILPEGWRNGRIFSSPSVLGTALKVLCRKLLYGLLYWF